MANEAAANGADLEKIARNIQTLREATVRSLGGSETASETAALSASLKDVFSVYAPPHKNEWEPSLPSSVDPSSIDPTSSSSSDELTSSHCRADAADAVILDVIKGAADFVSSEANGDAVDAMGREAPLPLEESPTSSLRSSLSMLSISSADADGWRLITDDTDNVNREVS